MDLWPRLQNCSDYVHALEEERKKIKMFQRELPLCLQLVYEAIESVRQQIDDHPMLRDDDRPVLEEFIPLKPTSTSLEERTISIKEAKKSSSEAAGTNKKLDWLHCVQLWNQDSKEPPKLIPVNAKKTEGAFHPFERENHPGEPAKSNISGGEGTDVGGGEEKEKDGQSQPHRKARRCWSPELHRRFLHAVDQLGGSCVATPKQIREMMKVDGLSNDEVKSHLQKYRLHTRRQNHGVQSSSNCAPFPQYVVVRGIWVPAGDYSEAAPAAMQSSGSPCSPPAEVYTPLQTLPPDLRFKRHQMKKKQAKGRWSGENNSTSEDVVVDDDSKCVSPTNSFSSQMTTTSPHSH
ncbi:hypothetical protein Cni_G02082 [Canna indica]|uniref:HTH myb-type domain-containing protein n=1 Tax=Canna indica TaxID=4628 RepID=A0AAQ3Q1U1_9LILI|nr:hypothetical protein Cni_G02082 [Canna indica]